MRILSLDVSSKTGWAVLEGEKGSTPKLIEYGQFDVPIKNFNVNDNPNKQKEYPLNLMLASGEVGIKCCHLIHEQEPDLIVIENTVKGRNRHTQRFLEFCHRALLSNLYDLDSNPDLIPFVYVDPSEWRSKLGVRLSKDDKSNNSKVYRAKKTGKTKKELGVKGKVTIKHVSVRAINELFGTSFIMKDNNISDAIGLGASWFFGE